MNTGSKTGLTTHCPECGTYGFRFLRAQDGGIINPKSPNIVLHQPVKTFTQDLRMVCPNPKCGYEYR